MNGRRSCSPDVVHRADVRVVEGRGGARLALEALAGRRVLEVVFREELQRHGAVQPDVLGLVHDADPAAAEPLYDAVVRDDLTDHALPRRTPGFAGVVFRVKTGRG